MPTGAVLPGRYASIQLKKDEIANAIAVPSEAIVPELGKDKIFLYQSGKAQPVEITSGIRTDISGAGRERTIRWRYHYRIGHLATTHRTTCNTRSY